MGKNVTDGERLAMAMYYNKDRELRETKHELNELKKELTRMVLRLSEVQLLNKSLCSDINYLVHKKANNA